MTEHEDPELWVRDYARRAEEMSERAMASQQQLANLQGEARNEYLTLVVNAGGALESITLTSRFRALSEKDMAEQLLDAYALAQETINTRTQGILRQIGGGDEMIGFVADSLTPEMRERAERQREEADR